MLAYVGTDDLDIISELLELTDEERELLKGNSITITFKDNGDCKSYSIE